MKNNESIEICKAKDSKKDCHVKKTLEIINGKWKLYILYVLVNHETIRFGEIKKAIPDITNTMLTSSLRELEEHNLVNRFQYNEIPPRVEYSLTESGRALLPIFHELNKWGETFLK